MTMNEELREKWDIFNALKTVEVDRQKAWEARRAEYFQGVAEVKRVKGTEREEWYAKGLPVLIKPYVKAKKAWWDAKKAASKAWEEADEMEYALNLQVLKDTWPAAMTPLERAREESDRAKQKWDEASEAHQASREACEKARELLSVIMVKCAFT